MTTWWFVTESGTASELVMLWIRGDMYVYCEGLARRDGPDTVFLYGHRAWILINAQHKADFFQEDMRRGERTMPNSIIGVICHAAEA